MNLIFRLAAWNIHKNKTKKNINNFIFILLLAFTRLDLEDLHLTIQQCSKWMVPMDLRLPLQLWVLTVVKVENVLKGSLDLMPSPSVKIQIMGGRVSLWFKGKTKFVDITQQCFALLPQVNLPDNNLNFHWRWRWWDQNQANLLNLFYLIS